jgi:hypothetical protein
MKLTKLIILFTGLLLLSIYRLAINKTIIYADQCGPGWYCMDSVVDWQYFCKKNDLGVCEAVQGSRTTAYCPDPVACQTSPYCSSNDIDKCQYDSGVCRFVGVCSPWYCCAPDDDPDPTPTAVPPPPEGSCDESCGTCGYRNTSNECETNNGCCHRTCSGPTCITVFGSGSNACNVETQEEDCGTDDLTPDPPTPTPTPYIKANLENPEGNPVSREICPVTCGLYGCYTENPPACSTTNSYTFNKPTSGWSYKGAGVTLSDDIVISVNPDPGGGQAGSRPGYHYYSWSDWSSGKKEVTFVLATPTPVPDPISFYLHGVSNADACENSTSSENPSSSNIPIKKSGTTIANFSASNNAAVNYDPADEDGQYSITPPSGWVCACSISGANQWPNCSLAAYNETIQWSITEVAESWWQTKGGNVHSQASINVDIPIDLTQQLSLSDNGAVGVITSDGTIGNNLIDAWKYPDNYGFNFDDNPIDYEFFWLQAGGPNTTNLSSTISQGDLVSGDTVFYINGDLALSDGNWNNTVNNRQVVVFVNGNLTIPKFEIPSHNLNIGNKGFLAFIVSGNINISAGHEDPSNDDVEIHGIFIADGDINITGEKNLRFVGKGIFAAGVDGNGSVTFNRDLGIDNNLFPPVLFIWDPELILNAPTILMQNSTSWHEVAPRGI